MDRLILRNISWLFAPQIFFTMQFHYNVVSKLFTSFYLFSLWSSSGVSTNSNMVFLEHELNSKDCLLRCHPLQYIFVNNKRKKIGNHIIRILIVQDMAQKNYPNQNVSWTKMHSFSVPLSDVLQALMRRGWHSSFIENASESSNKYAHHISNRTKNPVGVEIWYFSLSRWIFFGCPSPVCHVVLVVIVINVCLLDSLFLWSYHVEINIYADALLFYVDRTHTHRNQITYFAIKSCIPCYSKIYNEKKGISPMGYEEQSWFQNGYSTVSDSFQIIEIFVQKKKLKDTNILNFMLLCKTPTVNHRLFPSHTQNHFNDFCLVMLFGVP